MAKETFSSLIDLFKNSSSSSVSTLVCDVCGNKLSVFRKKKPCAECKRQFCSQCLQRCKDRALRCRNCCVLTMRPPHRSALLDLRTKDLQHYLNQHNVSTRGCIEKEDLVNVLLRYASAPGNPPAGNLRNPPPSNSGQPPPVNSRLFSTENSSSQAGNSSSVPVFSSATSAAAVDSSTAQGPRSEDTHLSFSQTASPHGDSDSSSDTSFEIVQRPGSDGNTSSGHSSSSSSTELERSSQSVSSSSATGAVVMQSEGRPGPPSSTVANSPVSRQPSAEMASQAEAPTPIPSLRSQDNVETPESVIESGIDSQEINTLSQPVSQTNSSNNSSNNSPNLLRGTMASIASETDFEALSVKNLKDILHRHRVNYHGCCEKAELVERAKRLYRDYCASRAELEKLDMDSLCKICMDAPVECVMLECGHMATCTDCGRQLSECPICRQFVVRIVRTFKA